MNTDRQTDDQVHQQTTMRMFLIGPSGAGKTAVAENLAQAAHVKLVDTDDEIERTCGMTVNEIWEKHGEDYFRGLERVVVERIAEMPGPVVIETGGGLPIIDGMMTRLDQVGTTVYLKATTRRMWRRLQLDE